MGVDVRARTWLWFFDSCCAPSPDSASWWEQCDNCYHRHSTSWQGLCPAPTLNPPQLFAFDSFKEHQHHLPGVYRMQVRGCLLCTMCPLQKELWKKTTEKWTVSAFCHPPVVVSEVTALWACFSEMWFLSWHLGMWRASKCSCCFSASW